MSTTNESESTPRLDKEEYDAWISDNPVAISVVDASVARKLELDLIAALKREAAWKKCAEGLAEMLYKNHIITKGCDCKFCKTYATFTELTKAK